jgi:hypothetical protein
MAVEGVLERFGHIVFVMDGGAGHVKDGKSDFGHEQGFLLIALHREGCESHQPSLVCKTNSIDV